MGKCLFLKIGGGVDPDELTATAGDILKGKTAIANGNDELTTGTLELTGNSGTNDVLTGKTFYTTNPKVKQTGTMPHNGAISGSLNCGQSKSIPAGYTTGGTIIANSLSSQTSATATAAYISSGKTAWVNGSKVTGALATQGGSTTTPGTTNKTIVTASKHVTGNIIVAGNGNLTAGNIKKGVNIFGVTGTWEGYTATPADLYKYGINNGQFKSRYINDSDTYVNFDSNQILMYAYGRTDDDGAVSSSAIIYSQNTYNLTGYSKITLTYYTYRASSSNNEELRLGIIANSSAHNLEAYTTTTGGSGGLGSTGQKTLVYNCSAINATKNIGVLLYNHAEYTPVGIYIYQISLS